MPMAWSDASTIKRRWLQIGKTGQSTGNLTADYHCDHQTFPHVLRAIENSTNLKQRRYAVIADEAHSSQSGSTARQLKVLMLEERERMLNCLREYFGCGGGCVRAVINLILCPTATPKTKPATVWPCTPILSYRPPSRTNQNFSSCLLHAKPLKVYSGCAKNYTNYKSGL